MKKIIGQVLSSDINKLIIGKITFKHVGLLTRKNFIYIANSNENAKLKLGYAATIVTSLDNYKKCSSKSKIVLYVDAMEIQYVTDGDIVSIEESGLIKILYEKGSSHNFLHLTELCNCSCIMCPNQFVKKENPKLQIILKVISLIDEDAKTLGISGGEPTLMKNQLLEILKACRKRIPKTKLIMLSNGILFDDLGYVKEIATICQNSLTVDIPLHSDTDTEHNNIAGTDGFYRTIQGLYNLTHFKQKIGLRIVVHKLNHLRLPQMAEFIYHNFPFVNHIAFMQMEPSGMARTNIDILWIDPYEYVKELEKAVAYLHRRGMNVSIYNAQLCVLPRSLWKYTKRSISTWKNIYLSECGCCGYKASCGGFFASSLETHSKYIRQLIAGFPC